jgi:hypothetical protein
LAIIGVDSSGQVGQPPIYFIAVRHFVEIGQREHLVFVSKNKYYEYVQLKSSLKIINWREKVSAILIFRAVRGIFQSNDSINIDVDFLGKSRDFVEGYIKRLFAKNFPKDRGRNNPNITFVPARFNEHVKEAHKKSKKARYGHIRINDNDPTILSEIELLQ